MGGPGSGNRTTSPDQRPQALRAVAARQAIAERFLAAANQTPTPRTDGPLAFPAFLQLRSIRIAHDGSLNLTMNVPAEHVTEMFLPLTSYCGYPLAVTMEMIELPDIDPLNDNGGAVEVME